MEVLPQNIFSSHSLKGQASGESLVDGEDTALFSSELEAQLAATNGLTSEEALLAMIQSGQAPQEVSLLNGQQAVPQKMDLNQLLLGARKVNQGEDLSTSKVGKESGIFLDQETLKKRGDLLKAGVAEKDSLEFIKAQNSLNQASKGPAINPELLALLQQNHSELEETNLNNVLPLKSSKGELSQALKIQNLLNKSEGQTLDPMTQNIMKSGSGAENFIEEHNANILNFKKGKILQGPWATTSQNEKLLGTLSEKKTEELGKLLDLAQLQNSAANGTTGLEKVQGAEESHKIFQLDSLKGRTVGEIIHQVKDYIIQNSVNARPSLELNFSHERLGSINLHVMKNQGQVDIKILTGSASAEEFFTNHRGELLAHLGNSGLSVRDLKIDSQTSHSNSSDSYQDQQDGQFARNPDHQGKRDSERRRDLWEQAQRQGDKA